DMSVPHENFNSEEISQKKQNKKIWKYIFFTLVILFILMLIPLPYYESKQLTCPLSDSRRSTGPCPTPGWRLNPPLIQSILLSNSKQKVTKIITPSPTPNTDNTKITCGGITGKLCPNGYTCTLEENYPDAAGICESDQRSGTLEATVMRSPTCAGPQKQGEICEAPDSNGTYLIISTVDYKTIRSINTDSNGKFSISLSPGIYMLQNTEIMIGKIYGISNFEISSGKTTTQRFDVDTGIR
ncbi:MAG: hypothetical protein AAB508_06425, partial [Patescibacteria group bacterium]